MRWWSWKESILMNFAVYEVMVWKWGSQKESFLMNLLCSHCRALKEGSWKKLTHCAECLFGLSVCFLSFLYGARGEVSCEVSCRRAVSPAVSPGLMSWGQMKASSDLCLCLLLCVDSSNTGSTSESGVNMRVIWVWSAVGVMCAADGLMKLMGWVFDQNCLVDHKS